MKNNNNQGIPFVDPLSKDSISKSAAEAVVKAKDASEKVVDIGNKDDDIIEIESSKEESDEKLDLVINLSNKYKFEGDVIETLDLSNLKNLSYKDVEAAEKLYFSGGNFAPVSELTATYCIVLAAQGCNYPLELLKAFKANDITKIKNAVSTFLLS